MTKVSLAGKKVLVTLPVTDEEREVISGLIGESGGSVSFVLEPDVVGSDVDEAAIAKLLALADDPDIVKIIASNDLPVND